MLTEGKLCPPRRGGWRAGEGRKMAPRKGEMAESGGALGEQKSVWVKAGWVSVSAVRGNSQGERDV